MTKELLPVGEICPWVENGKPISIKVKEPFLDKMISQFKQFQSVGVRVPFFKTHIEDPDNDRGTILDVVKRPNKAGVMSSFIRVKFHDEDAKKQCTRVDVSALCPKEFVDGKGNKYEYPLRHVAATSVPVVPGLEEWKGPMVLSFDTPSGLQKKGLKLANEGGGGSMSELILKILDALGVTPPEGSSEIEQLRLALQEIQNLEEVEEPALNLSFPSTLVRQFKLSREALIDSLISEHVLTPARGDDWKKRYCSDDAIKADLKLSNDSGETEFDRMVAEARALAKDRPLENVGRNVIKLSKSEDGKDNPMIAAAKRAKERAKEKRA
jgi:hypothetical protein